MRGVAFFSAHMMTRALPLEGCTLFPTVSSSVAASCFRIFQKKRKKERAN